MKKIHPAILIALLLLFCLCLSACGGKTAGSPAASPTVPEAPTAEAAPSPAQEAETSVPAEEASVPTAEAPVQEESAVEPDAALPVRVMTLNGTTGFGMAGMMADSNAGNASLNYSFTVETDASNVTAALVNGNCDIAALPTNAASALYNKQRAPSRFWP